MLITGAGGFAGRHLADACRAAGDEVRAAPRSVTADLRDAAAARRIVAEAMPEVVYHLAARAHVGASWEDPQGTIAANLGMTVALLEAVRTSAPDAVVVVVGSGEQYGAPDELPTTEDTPPRPQNPYAVSKAAGDLAAGFYADAHGLRVVRVRAFNHAGPGQEPHYAVASFAKQVAAGLDAGDEPVRVVTGSPDTRRDYTDVRDVVRAYRLLAARGEPGAWNVCSGVSRSARELVAALCEVTRVAIEHVIDPARVRAHEVHEIRGSSARLRTDTGWAPEIPMSRTLSDTVASFRR